MSIYESNKFLKVATRQLESGNQASVVKSLMLKGYSNIFISRAEANIINISYSEMLRGLSLVDRIIHRTLNIYKEDKSVHKRIQYDEGSYDIFKDIKETYIECYKHGPFNNYWENK